MEIVDQLKLSRASAVLQQEIRKHGQIPSMGQDFYHFKRLIDELPDRDISDQFNLDHETLKPTEAFWVICRGHNGGLIAAVAAKLEDLGPMNAADYWKMHLPRVYRENARRPIEFEPAQSRAAANLKGRLVYVGDAYASPELRKSGLAPAMGKLAQLAAFGMWNFDTCYAFIHNAGMVRGVGTNHGFCHQHEIAIRWKTNPPQFLPDNWLVYNHRNDVLDLIDRLSGSDRWEGRE
ncbi:MAG: hypothetical protein AAGF59_06510 [Pseudomonadota bacterium]